MYIQKRTIYFIVAFFIGLTSIGFSNSGVFSSNVNAPKQKDVEKLVLKAKTSLEKSNEMMWHKDASRLYGHPIKKFTIHPTNDHIIFAASSNMLYRSLNKGRDYMIVWQSMGDDQIINSIYVPKIDEQKVYITTNSGLYESKDLGEQWNRIYFSSGERFGKCRAVLKTDQFTYLGTDGGLFYKEKDSQDWKKYGRFLNRVPVYQIIREGNFIFIGTNKEVYLFDEQDFHMTKIFNLIGKTNDDFDAGHQPLIKKIHLTNKSNMLYVLSSKGIFYGVKEKRDWHRLESDMIPLDLITSIVSLNDGLFIGTKRGVFYSKNGRWTPVFKGMEVNEINELATDANGGVYAATERGVFYLSNEQMLPSSLVTSDWRLASSNNQTPDTGHQPLEYKDIMQSFKHEPSINIVHQLAIDYAEVNNGKIQSWRKLSRKKAWLPKLTAGFDGGHDQSISDSIYGSSSGSDHIGPDDKSFGRDFGWDVSLSWDFADLIWNTDQTTIDSRSKLMVELREDVLDQVTRLFFERRRIQIELMKDESDSQLVLEKKMRIDELTALLDGFTGGGFSRLIQPE